MREGAYAPGLIIPDIVGVTARSDVVALARIPEFPQLRQHLAVVIGDR